jgi:hypothetical protein
MRNPSTLIIRFYGFHRVQLLRGEKHYFVVMGNIFAQSLEIHERYDLKVCVPSTVVPSRVVPLLIGSAWRVGVCVHLIRARHWEEPLENANCNSAIPRPF